MEGIEAIPYVGDAVAAGEIINECMMDEAKRAAEKEHDRIVRAMHGLRSLPEALAGMVVVDPKLNMTEEQYFNHLASENIKAMGLEEYLDRIDYSERAVIDNVWNTLRDRYTYPHRYAPGFRRDPSREFPASPTDP